MHLVKQKSTRNPQWTASVSKVHVFRAPKRSANNKDEVLKEYAIRVIDKPIKGKYDVIIFTVEHDDFKKLTFEEIKRYGKVNSVIYDIKYLLDANQVDGRI